MKILVTGALGFIAVNFCHRFKDKYEIIGLSRTYRGERVVEGVDYIFGSITDSDFVEKVIMQKRPDIIYNLAAITEVKLARDIPRETFVTNVIGTLNLLEAAKRLENVYIVHQSSDKVLAEGDGKTEASSYGDKLDIYGRSKHFQELLIKEYEDFFPSLIVRACNIYGAWDQRRTIIPNTIRNCMDGRSPMIYKEENPSHRQYVYIDDLLNAIKLLIEEKKEGLWHVGGEIKTNEEVVLEITKHFNVNAEYTTPKHKRGILKQSLNYNKIQSLGWKPAIPFSEGIKKTVRWWTSYEALKR